jgi:hypothetical protein
MRVYAVRPSNKVYAINTEKYAVETVYIDPLHGAEIIKLDSNI